jgi:MFS superfamily sulfate permease-like transporter
VPFIVSVLKKLDCPILILEFLSRFFVDLTVGVLQAIVVACI